jgi:hypothetical protein
MPAATLFQTEAWTEYSIGVVGILFCLYARFKVVKVIIGRPMITFRLLICSLGW